MSTAEACPEVRDLSQSTRFSICGPISKFLFIGVRMTKGQVSPTAPLRSCIWRRNGVVEIEGRG